MTSEILLTVFLLVILLIPGLGVEKITDSAESTQTDQLKIIRNDTIPREEHWARCDSIWKSRRTYFKMDSLIGLLLKESGSTITANNRMLLESLRNTSDSTFQFEQPLSAVFHLDSGELFIMSNFRYHKVGKHFRAYSYESDYLDQRNLGVKYEEALYSPWQIFSNTLQEIPNRNKSLILYGRESSFNSSVLAVGMKYSDCEPFSFVTIDDQQVQDDEVPLVASGIQLDLEYGNWAEIDQLINDDPIYNCFDCLHTYDEARTFAKLEGVEDVYFTYVGTFPYEDEMYTPARSLVYKTEEGIVVSLWSDSMDLFGCACL